MRAPKPTAGCDVHVTDWEGAQFSERGWVTRTLSRREFSQRAPWDRDKLRKFTCYTGRQAREVRGLFLVGGEERWTE